MTIIIPFTDAVIKPNLVSALDVRMNHLRWPGRSTSLSTSCGQQRTSSEEDNDKCICMVDAAGSVEMRKAKNCKERRWNTYSVSNEVPIAHHTHFRYDDVFLLCDEHHASRHFSCGVILYFLCRDLQFEIYSEQGQWQPFSLSSYL